MNRTGGRAVAGGRLALAALVPLMLTLVACDDDGLVNGDDDVQMEYVGTVTPLNSSGVSGTVEFVVDEDDDDFTVGVQIAGLVASELHPQHVHAAAACPTMEADENGDGYLDVLEGAPTYGLILLNLDSDLTAYAPNTFPTATVTGAVSYSQAISFDALIAAIGGMDDDMSDPFTKLGGESLSLETRTYVIHGIDPNTELPQTVQSIAGLPPQVTLPVGCAEITLVN